MSRMGHSLSNVLRNKKLALAVGAAALFAFGAAIAAQDKYTLQVPGGLAFSEFKGYENWQSVSLSPAFQVLASLSPTAPRWQKFIGRQRRVRMLLIPRRRSRAR